ncbi:MAG: AraC family transcriptional regulator [Alistipes sp.]|nr:AraC family transcriptional regulator [Alistipes sp.]
MIQQNDWLPFLEGLQSVASIAGELSVFNFADVRAEISSELKMQLRQAQKYDFFIVAKHLKGSIRLNINMDEYELSGGGQMLQLSPGQIVSIEDVSDDFDANVVFLSRHFIESMMVYISGSMPFRMNISHPVISTPSEEELQIEKMFFDAALYVVNYSTSQYRMQVMQHIMMAIFYASNAPSKLNDNGERARTNADVLSKQFMELVQANFRKERQLKFYAEALCITPRYLSRVVKECTGASAADWIERYVVLEARALLKSTTMTIQQISDHLNFPSQTFFGKYFKRRAGMSPKEYRRKS